MNEKDLLEYQAQGLGKVITGFPYVQRFCPYCEEEMLLVNAAHIEDAHDQYKAIFICYNRQCDFYNKYPNEAYVRVYYSSQYAVDQLTPILLRFFRPKKELDEKTKDAEQLEDIGGFKFGPPADA